MHEIVINNARENNLKNVSLKLPHYCLIAVTGVSGSGKTSLVYDILNREGKRLLYENFSVGGKLKTIMPSQPDVSGISGLFPVISINQNNYIRTTSSTVGTSTGIYDYLRLLFARLGKTEIPDIHLNRSLFSFNHPNGYCNTCKGIGLEDRIEISSIIGDENKTIRQGALKLTTPNNYIIYSQVTMDVLNQVCTAEGFNVDIPWKELTDEQKNVIFYGSDKIKILFGKHTLESRLKWTGITAKPREEGFYKGIITVMEDILKRDRNPGILKYAGSFTCSDCEGKRLNEQALSVTLWGNNIDYFNQLNIGEIDRYFRELSHEAPNNLIFTPIKEAILNKTTLLIKLGLSHLKLSRPSSSMNSGETQRIRLASFITSGLRNILYILDEPSAGLHPSEQNNLIEILHDLVNKGNTVIVVDHDEQTIRRSHFIIDIGPGAGINGGEVVFAGKAKDFFNDSFPQSITWQYLIQKERKIQQSNICNQKFIEIKNANWNNLKNFNTGFYKNALNVISGISGSGKSSLANFINKTLRSEKSVDFQRIINIDSSPIGRNPNSNPATYTGLSDHIRDLFASLPESKEKSFKKGQFSFVVKGGRCESCGGAGIQQTGLHFLGTVETICEECNGKRFTSETLSIRFNGKNIFDIMEMSVNEASEFFNKYPKITKYTSVMKKLGLGYLKLGQPSTTLSGGEAQRIKLASELSGYSSGNNLYIFDEPTTGLHPADIEILISALKELCSKKNTVICTENDPQFLAHSDWIIELGTGSGINGGSVINECSPEKLPENKSSVTGKELLNYLHPYTYSGSLPLNNCKADIINSPLLLKGVKTNNLKNINASFPVSKITAITGVSGSGKSSLAYGTLFAECQKRFLEGLPAYQRFNTNINGYPILSSVENLTPAISIRKKNIINNPRSTIATYTGLYDLYRLLFSRLSKSSSGKTIPLSSSFSFNSEEGACSSCKGIGTITTCNPEKLITNPDLPLTAGALHGSKTGKFYGDPHGQWVATLLATGKKYKIDFSIPYNQLSEKAKEIALYGCGDEKFDVKWEYKRGNAEGIHEMSSVWAGFINLVDNEYIRKHADNRGEAMLSLMKNIKCSHCNGYRLKSEIMEFHIKGLNIGELTNLSAENSYNWFENNFDEHFDTELQKQIALVISEKILNKLNSLIKAGIGYIATSREVRTLSGGEFQRLQIAGLIRTPFTGVTYILDEPSFGLHKKDISRISDLTKELHNAGNTVIMVENSPVMLSGSNNIMEIGPGAGSLGGEIVSFAKTNDVLKKYYTPKIKTTLSSPQEGLYIKKAYANNLKDISLHIPSEILTVITGVSGSGKTSLMSEVIFKSHIENKAVNCLEIKGFNNFNEVIFIEQPVPSATKTISIATYTNISEIISRIFSSTEQARLTGYKSPCFIPFSKDGRCDACDGKGSIKTSMDYFADVMSICESCNGTGFKDPVLKININGLSVYDVLQLPLSELKNFCLYHQNKKEDLEIFSYIEKAGLDYLNAGRLLSELSTGELQRLRLVKGLLSTQNKNKVLYLLDEPTAGLHFSDSIKLAQFFKTIIANINTIICISHDEVISSYADKIISLGPGGGEKGGEVL